MAGYIRIDRKILDWEWYSDANTCRLFIHLLLKANWRDGRFQGIDIPRGSLITSYNTLADESGLSVRNVRTALEHLKTTGEVTVSRHSKFSVITIKNYSLYQTGDTVADNQVTVNRQTTDNQVTTIEESNKGINKKKNKESIVRFTPPTPENVTEYCREKGYQVDAERFVDFYESKGWMIGKNKMKDWKAAVRTWAKSEKKFAGSDGTSAKRTKFSNFTERSYNFDELEKQFLGGQED